MRVDSAIPFPHRRRRRAAFVALFLAGVLVCSNSSEPTAPSATFVPAVGWLSGSVTLLGNDGPTPAAGQVMLYATLEELDLRRPRYGAVLNRRSAGVRVYDFVIGSVRPGDYYVLACWTVGCGEYRDPSTGALRTVRIRAGRTTRLSFGL